MNELVPLLAALGYTSYVPIILAVIGLFSAISTVYPHDWPYASVIHTMALLLGKATPVPIPTQSAEHKE